MAYGTGGNTAKQGTVRARVAAPILPPQDNIDDKAPQLSALQFPEAREGKPIPVVVGRRHLTSPNLVFYKAVRRVPDGDNIKYHAHMHLALCHSPAVVFEVLAGGKRIDINRLYKEQITDLVTTVDDITRYNYYVELTGFDSSLSTNSNGTLHVGLGSTSDETVDVIINQNGDVGRGNFIDFKNTTLNNDGDEVTLPVTYPLTLNITTPFDTKEVTSYLTAGSETYYVQISSNFGVTRISGDEYRLFIAQFEGELHVGLWATDYNAISPTGLSSEIPNASLVSTTALFAFINTKNPNEGVVDATGASINLEPAIYQSFFVYVDRPNLYGGIKESGGFVTKLHYLDGVSDLLSDTKKDITESVEFEFTPDYKGVVSLFMRDAYLMANTTSVPSITADMGAYYNSLGIAHTYSTVRESANPACFLYEALVNTAWGASIPESAIDKDSFLAAGETLFFERVGCSFIWSDIEAVSKVISKVISDIVGMWYTDKDGLIAMKLIRPFTGDVNSLTEVVPLGRAKAKNDTPLNTVNQLTATYVEHTATEDVERILKDTYSPLANLAEKIVNKDIALPTLATEEAAKYILRLKLILEVTTVQTYSVTVNRFGYNLSVGDFVRFYHEGSSSSIHRVVEVEHKGKRSTLGLTEDVFEASPLKLAPDIDDDVLYVIPTP